MQQSESMSRESLGFETNSDEEQKSNELSHHNALKMVEDLTSKVEQLERQNQRLAQEVDMLRNDKDGKDHCTGVTSDGDEDDCDEGVVAQNPIEELNMMNDTEPVPESSR